MRALILTSTIAAVAACGACGDTPCEETKTCDVGPDPTGSTSSSGVGGAPSTSSSSSSTGVGGAGGDGPPVEYDAGRQLCVGSQHSCAISGGAVKCWGGNLQGQIGTGQTSNEVLQPFSVTLPAAPLEVACGASTTCARLDDGDTWCWGRGNNGQLGHGLKAGSPTPVKVSSTKPALELAASRAGQGFHVRHADGTVSSWGGAQGLGAGAGAGESASPRQLTVDQVTKLHGSSCVSRGGGELWCWGDTAAGDAPSFTGAVDVIAASKGTYHLCIVSSTGVAQCRGENFCGVLGLGATTTTAPTLSPLPGGTSLARLDCSVSACVAGRSSGGPLYWGSLLNGSCSGGGNPDAPQPTAAPFTMPTIAEAVGSSHACVMTDGGAVFCWGMGGSGQLGQGASADSTSPVQVQGL